MAQYFAGDLEPEYRMFVAIDLGTTNSACAFALGRDSSEIHLASEKIPTALLLTPSKELHSFGKDAMDNFFLLEEEEDRVSDYYYFDRFKMKLHNDGGVRPGMQLQTIDGKELPARTVFGKSLEYFRKLALSEIGKCCGVAIFEAEIKWILTVPAIWGDRAKEFMKNAAQEAGMNPDAVELALEPEGAAFRCRDDLQHVHRKIGSPPTLRYVVADCGGGTIDVTVHELAVTARKIDELHRATGGNWGGTTVDNEILDLVHRIIGEDVASKIAEIDWLRFCRDSIEETKRKVGTTADEKVIIQMTQEILLAIQDAGGNIDRSASRFDGALYRSRKASLMIDLPLVKKCFEKSLASISDHVRQIMSKVGDIHCILVVGGYADSNLLMEHMEREFGSSEVTVIRPKNASIAVVAGAVAFGQNPSIVQSRKSKYSYGINCMVPFQKGKHKREKMVMTERGPKCRDVFNMFVQVDEGVPAGHVVRKNFKPTSKTQRHFCLALYRSPHPTVEYTDDKDCEKLGQIDVISENIKKGFDRIVIVSMNFAATSLKFGALEKNAGSAPNEFEKLQFKFECV